MEKPMITRVPEEQRRQFDRLAERSGVSRAQLLRSLVTEFLAEHERLPRPVPAWPDLDPDAPALDDAERGRVLADRYEQRAARR